MGIFKRKGAVTDDAILRPACIAGIADVERGHAQVAPLRLVEKAMDRKTAARPVTVAAFLLKPLDRDRRLGILRRAGRIIVVMAQIGRDDYRGFWSSPQHMKRLGHLLARRLRHENGKDFHFAQRAMNEW